jgi:hypothetical protein
MSKLHQNRAATKQVVREKREQERRQLGMFAETVLRRQFELAEQDAL